MDNHELSADLLLMVNISAAIMHVTIRDLVKSQEIHTP